MALDSRDLIEELAELKLEQEDRTLCAFEADRVAAIEALADDVGGEWDYGVVLIPEDEFVEYAQDLAEDIGAIDPSAGWPMRCIDWEQAAAELRMDYTSVAFDGVSYLVRA